MGAFAASATPVDRARIPIVAARPGARRESVLKHDPCTGPARVDFRSQLGRALQPVTIEIAVEFRPAVIRPAQLFQLSVGDVLPLSHPTTAPLSVTAAGTVVARAVPGAEGSNLAVLIVDPKSQEASAW